MVEDDAARARRAAQVEKRRLQLQLENRKEAQQEHSKNTQQRGMENLDKGRADAAAKGTKTTPISWDY